MGLEGSLQVTASGSTGLELYAQHTVPLQQAGEISTHFQRMRANLLESFAAEDIEAKREQANKIAERRQAGPVA